MTMVSLLVALFLLGMVFISFELIVPGGILGLIGILCILGSWGIAFAEFGPHGGVLAVLIGLVAMAVSLAIELRFIPRTRVGRRLFLDRAIDATSHASPAAPDIVGREGEALTTLAPTGMARIDGKTYEAFSMSGLVEKGSRVEVVDFDNFRVRVKKI